MSGKGVTCDGEKVVTEKKCEEGDQEYEDYVAGGSEWLRGES